MRIRSTSDFGRCSSGFGKGPCVDGGGEVLLSGEFVMDLFQVLQKSFLTWAETPLSRLSLSCSRPKAIRAFFPTGTLYPRA